MWSPSRKKHTLADSSGRCNTLMEVLHGKARRPLEDSRACLVVGPDDDPVRRAGRDDEFKVVLYVGVASPHSRARHTASARDPTPSLR